MNNDNIYSIINRAESNNSFTEIRELYQFGEIPRGNFLIFSAQQGSLKVVTYLCQSILNESIHDEVDQDINEAINIALTAANGEESRNIIKNILRP